jgi:hypothetical protein
LFDLTRIRAQQRAEDFNFEFGGHDAVVLLYKPNPGADAGPLWPAATRQSMEQYMRRGGGLVVIHAANNAFAHWVEFNQMTGIGGWGERWIGVHTSTTTPPELFSGTRRVMIRQRAQMDRRTNLLSTFAIRVTRSLQVCQSSGSTVWTKSTSGFAGQQTI